MKLKPSIVYIPRKVCRKGRSKESRESSVMDTNLFYEFDFGNNAMESWARGNAEKPLHGCGARAHLNMRKQESCCRWGEFSGGFTEDFEVACVD